MSDPGFPKRKRERKRHAHIGAFNRQCIRGTPGITLLQQTDIPPKGPHDVTEHNHNTGQNTNTHHDTPPHATHTPHPYQSLHRGNSTPGVEREAMVVVVGSVVLQKQLTGRPDHTRQRLCTGEPDNTTRETCTCTVKHSANKGGEGCFKPSLYHRLVHKRGQLIPQEAPPGGGEAREGPETVCVQTYNHTPHPRPLENKTQCMGWQASTNQLEERHT